MESRCTYFFGTRGDLEPGIRAFEAGTPVNYAQAGLFQTADVRLYCSALEIPEFGISPAGDRNHDPAFLIIPVGIELNVRGVPQRQGGVRYAVDQQYNSESIVARFGGLYREECLIQSEVGTIAGTPTSAVLYRAFVNTVVRGFVKCRGYRIGSEALTLYESGYRFTDHAGASSDYDVKI